MTRTKERERELLVGDLGVIIEDINIYLVKPIITSSEPNSPENRNERERYETAILYIERARAALLGKPMVQWKDVDPSDQDGVVSNDNIGRQAKT